MTETVSAASALQTAIYRLLAGFAPLTALTGVSGIVDRRLSAPTSPLVVIAAIDSTDRSTSTEAGEEHTVTLEVWSQAAGHRQAQAIEAAVRTALHDTALTLAGHHLVLLLHRDTRLRRDGSSRFHRAEMRFRAVTEPAA